MSKPNMSQVVWRCDPLGIVELKSGALRFCYIDDYSAGEDSVAEWMTQKDSDMLFEFVMSKSASEASSPAEEVLMHEFWSMPRHRRGRSGRLVGSERRIYTGNINGLHGPHALLKIGCCSLWESGYKKLRNWALRNVGWAQ